MHVVSGYDIIQLIFGGEDSDMYLLDFEVANFDLII